MPTSRSASRGVKPAAQAPSTRRRSYWPLVLIGLIAVLGVIIAALPASIIAHFLPPSIRAEDFSGSFWHGSAGRITVNARDAGALEWRLHPGGLLALAADVDLHWVKVGFVIDAAVKVDRRGFTARDIKGHGPIEDLRDFGVTPGWRGIADMSFSELKGDYIKPLAAVGDIQVANLMSAQVADGANLGSYDLKFAAGAVDADGNVASQLKDTGGPLDVQAAINYTARERTAILTGSLRERPDVPAALRRAIDSLSQMRGRDPQGRVPVDFEFRF